MASAPVDIPVQVKGLSDLQKLERRMLALEREIQRLNKATPKAENNVRGLGRASRGAAGGVKTLGVAIKSTLAPLLAATATIGGLTAGFRAIAGQDFSEAKVRSLGVNSAQLVENLREVSKELQGNASVAELTAAAYDVASAGFTNAADAAMVLKAASLGAVGGFSDINTVGDAATSVLNAYGKSAKDAGKLVDGFIQTQNDGKIVVDEYARNIGKVASAAAGLKIPIEEVNAVIAQSTASGVQAEVAFTGLKGALARLASGEATKALKGVGLEINAATLEADGLLGTFKKIKAAGLDTGQLFKAFGTEAGPALLPVLQNLEKFEELLKNQENAAGAAQRAQQQAANTINGAWNRVRVAFENLFSDQAELAKALIPILDAVATAINGCTKALKNFGIIAGEVQGTIDSIGRQLPLVAQAFGKLGEAITFAANALGKLLLRADGFEAMDASGFGRGTRNFGANYKEQEAALFKAAEAFKTAQKEAQLTTTQTTPIPSFNPATSGGGLQGAAGEAEDLLKKQMAAGEELARQFERRLELLKTEDELEKTLLENKFDFEDQIREINKTAAPLQREGLIKSATAERNIKDAKAIGKALGEAAANVEPPETNAFEDYIAETQKALGDTDQMLADMAQTVETELATAMADAFVGFIDGSKTAQEAAADMFANIGKAFIEMATAMIAKALILKALGVPITPESMGGGSGGGGILDLLFGGSKKKASGGTMSAGGTYLVGEQGPELITMGSAGGYVYNNSSSQTQAALATYSPGNNTSESGSMDPIDVRFETMSIGSVDYVTKEEAMKMTADAAERGAAAGYAKTVRAMRYQPSARRQMGI